MSSNICPRCGKPIRLPQEEVMIVRNKVGRNKFEDRMVHKACPTGQPTLSQVGGQEYCTNCDTLRPFILQNVPIPALATTANAKDSASRIGSNSFTRL